MKRYRSKPPLRASRLRSDGEGDYVWLNEYEPMERSLTVFEQEPGWESTGILGPDGQPLEYLVTMEPIGFLHEFFEGEEE